MNTLYLLFIIIIFNKFYLHQLLLRIYIYAHDSSLFSIKKLSICCSNINIDISNSKKY